ncbi:MAG: pyruvate ferredoxin oxidoreductase [Dehalococcoidia bacterium]|nr:pyruvate ferredoxin oxidoreductase [Dehalococcoidia bacterium]
MTKKFLEGSRAVAEVVAMCKPQVISAYPITPQTHIVAELAQMVSDGELKAEYVNVESEHSAASVILGASATGVRTYTSTTSQGMMLMNEVIYNIAGMRLPCVMTLVNRSISAPLNIWTDHQDSISVRDAGWIQIYAENNQDTADYMIQAFRLAEDHRVMLPVMICMDGFVLSHAYETIDIPDQEQVDKFLPPYSPIYKLDPSDPLTFGAYAEPDKYTETRYMIHETMRRALTIIPEIGAGFEKAFGRKGAGLIETYKMEDANTAIIALGSVNGIIKETVDQLRTRGRKVGAVKVVTFRPFPSEAVAQALAHVRDVVVLDRAISLGSGGPLATEIRSCLEGRRGAPKVRGVIGGLGGRDITEKTIKEALDKSTDVDGQTRFLELNPNLELEGID